MASKYDLLRARFRGLQKKTERGAVAALHTAETLGATALTGFMMGRLSDDKGEWGFRGVPYPLVGAGALFLTGLFSGDKYQDHVMALGTGVAAPWVGVKMYQYGVEQKSKAKTSGVRPGQRQFTGANPNVASMMADIKRQHETANVSADKPKGMGTAFDGQ